MYVLELIVMLDNLSASSLKMMLVAHNVKKDARVIQPSRKYVS